MATIFICPCHYPWLNLESDPLGEYILQVLSSSSISNWCHSSLTRFIHTAVFYSVTKCKQEFPFIDLCSDLFADLILTQQTFDFQFHARFIKLQFSPRHFVCLWQDSHTHTHCYIFFSVSWMWAGFSFIVSDYLSQFTNSIRYEQ